MEKLLRVKGWGNSLHVGLSKKDFQLDEEVIVLRKATYEKLLRSTPEQPLKKIEEAAYAGASRAIAEARNL